MNGAAGVFEQVVDFYRLRAAARRARRGIALGSDAAAFLAELEPNVLRLQRELRDGRYRPGPYRTFRIRDPKPRTISAAPFRDRVVHHALCAAMEPIFERYAVDHSYACRRGLGTTAALARARELARRHAHFIKLDVSAYFESIDHARLREQLAGLCRDGRVFALAARFIAAGAPGSPPGKGLPIGNLTSQHFANLHLGLVDHLVQDSLGAGPWCRYMDDMLLFGDDAGRLAEARSAIADFLDQRMGLALRLSACRTGRVADGVPFLGFRIWPHHMRLDRARRLRLGRQLRAIANGIRTGVLDEPAAVARVASLCGWAAMADTRALLASQLASAGLDRQWS